MTFRTWRWLMSGILACAGCIALSGCHKKSAQPQTQTQAQPATSSDAAVNSAPPVAPPEDPVVDRAFSPELMRGATIGAQGDPHTFTPSELQFGRAPKRTSDVVYKSDAVIFENGDKMLRSMSSDGVRWHFDANAPGVDQIQKGKVIFATERCVGRVLDVQRQGDELVVLLGPIQITDVIQKAHMAFNGPVDMSNMVVVIAPNFPAWRSSYQGQVEQSMDAGQVKSMTYAVVSPTGEWRPFRALQRNQDGHLVDATWHTTARKRARLLRPFSMPAGEWRGTGDFAPRPHLLRAAQTLPAPGALPGVSNPPTPALNLPPAPAPQIGGGGPPTVNLGGMTMHAMIPPSAGGIGVKFEYYKHGVKVIAYIIFKLKSPALKFNLDIEATGIHTAAIRLSGGAGFAYHFECTSANEFNGNINQLGNLPIDLSLPILNFGVPISLHLIQSLNLSSGFSARNSYLSEDGEYTAAGAIEVGYVNGSWGGGVPNLSLNRKLASGVTGISMGINSIVFNLRQELLLGIGMFGFSTGPYAAVTTTMTALKQSSAAMVDCRQATFGMQLDAGVGYTLPTPLVAVLNVFLHALNQPEMSSVGSLFKMDPKQFVDMRSEIPSGCAEPKGGG